MKARLFNKTADVLRFIKSQADDIERAQIYVCSVANFIDKKTGKPYRMANVGLTLFMLDESRLNISREMTCEILNDGILTKMRIETKFV